MGVAMAGIAFRPKNPNQPVEELVADLLSSPCFEIPHPDQGEFDIRRSTDVMVEFFGDVWFIYSNDLIWDILTDFDADVSRLTAMLGHPDLILGFCHYDSGGAFGYTFIENGVRTRSRMQMTDEPGYQPCIERGTPKPLEARWLSLPTYEEEVDDDPPEHIRMYRDEVNNCDLPEYSLTSVMLDEALETYFGVCPWEVTWAQKSANPDKPRFFKLGGQPVQPQTEAPDGILGLIKNWFKGK